MRGLVVVWGRHGGIRCQVRFSFPRNTHADRSASFALLPAHEIPFLRERRDSFRAHGLAGAAARARQNFRHLGVADSILSSSVRSATVRREPQ
jgi:hypothetical protein